MKKMLQNFGSILSVLVVI